MQNADAIYYETLGDVASKAVAKALPKAWAAKAKAYAVAKAVMLPGPPLPRQVLEECADHGNGRPTHRTILQRATAAPAKAKAAAALQGVPLNAQQDDVLDVVSRVEDLAGACYKATFPLRTSLKRQRDGKPVVKSDAAKNIAEAATAVKNFDTTIDGIFEDFMDRSNL
eukprot:GEMP01097381.1.p1 GENE.GEMP01097381.1~~GEMP01097381.1.p1  ORF type:complete len:192 (-),score=24.09 GEMP01097381.1:266-772(-)